MDWLHASVFIEMAGGMQQARRSRPAGDPILAVFRCILGGAYRWATERNMLQVVEEKGNSPRIFNQHYRRILPKAAGKGWFEIYLDGMRGNVVQIEFLSSSIGHPGGGGWGVSFVTGGGKWGHLFFLGARRLTVIEAGSAFKVLARNKLLERITGTPAIAANTLYVRTTAHIWAFRK